MSSTKRGRLVGWKSIGAFVGRDARTAKRWEKHRAMPVYRVPGGVRPTVWADPVALEGWLEVRDRADTLDLAARLPPSREPVMEARRPVEDAERDDLRLTALYGASSRTPGGLELAMTSYAQLLRGGPDAQALCGLAECHLLMREFGSSPDGEAFEKAWMFARWALACEPTSADAIRILGFLQFWGSGSADLGLRSLADAVALQPDNAPSRHWLATALSARGQWAAALLEIEAARRLNPTSVAILADRALICYGAGERERARASLENLVKTSPTFSSVHGYLGQIALVEGRDEDFLTHLELEARLRDDMNGVQAARRYRALLTGGGTSAMRLAYAEHCEELGREGQLGAFQVARSWANANDRPKALTWLETCKANSEPSVSAVRGDFVLNHYLSGQPRFAALCADC